MRIWLLAVAAAVVAAPPGSAQEVRQLGAHVHGRAQLLVGIDGPTVSIELRAPGMDLVGFEHAAISAEDKMAVDDAIARLVRGGELFDFGSQAGCRLDLAVAGLAEGEHVHEHAEGEDHAHAEGETHTEFEAVYEFACARPGAVAAIATGFFAAFPLAGVIDLQAVGAGGAATAELSPARASADIRGAL